MCIRDRSFLPAFIGFWVGVLFLLLLDRLIPHLHVGSEQAEGPKSKLGRTTMMVLAVTLHNIPEGMAVGVVYAGFLSGNTQITAASALALSLGIAIQNFPEEMCIRDRLKAVRTVFHCYHSMLHTLHSVSYTHLSSASLLPGFKSG